MSEFVIWWLDQPAHQLTTALGGPTTMWPDYIRREFVSRGGRAGRGRLWVPKEISFKGIDWKDGDPAFDAVGRDCGGIVIHRQDAKWILAWPGFVTDDHLRVLTIP